MADDESKSPEVSDNEVENDTHTKDVSTDGDADVKDAKSGETPKKVKESPKKEAKKESPKKEAKKESAKKESPKKEPKKEEKKDDGSDEEDDDDDSDNEEEALPPGLLEQPLTVTGKREKKKVERLSATMVPNPNAEKKKVEIEEGKGEKLGDIAYIEHQISVTKAVDLKPLHRVLFSRLASNYEMKKNIRQFSGLTHEKDSKEYEKRVTLLNKYVQIDLKNICLTLGLERGGTKKEAVERIMDFLMKPTDTGAQIKAKKRSKSAATKGKKRKRTPKKTEKAGKKSASTTKKKKKKPVSEDDEDDEEEEEDMNDNEEEEEEDDDDAEEQDSEDEEPKKKKAKTEPKKKAEPKKTPAKKVAKENGKKEKAPPKEAKKKTPKKKSENSDDRLSDDSDDEPIANMIKSPPSNDEIKDLVKNILDGADLETVTMKTVVKQVYAKYPSFDLSDRKDFIKDTVRQVIS